MNKLKWKYDSKFKQWFINDSAERYDYTITKLDNKAFVLEAKPCGFINPTIEHTFSKLKSAKQVAELIENG